MDNSPDKARRAAQRPVARPETSLRGICLPRRPNEPRSWRRAHRGYWMPNFEALISIALSAWNQEADGRDESVRLRPRVPRVRRHSPPSRSSAAEQLDATIALERLHTASV